MFETAAFVTGVVYYHQFMDKFHRWFPRLQLRRFRRLLAHAQQHSPYLKQKYRGIDSSTAVPADVPAITKAEMMANFEGIVTNRRIRRADVEAFVSNPANVGRLFLDKYPLLHTSGSQCSSKIPERFAVCFPCKWRAVTRCRKRGRRFLLTS
jgi:hypothetical protein